MNLHLSLLLVAPLLGTLTAATRCQTNVVVPCVADNTLYAGPFGGTLSNGAGPGIFAGMTAFGDPRRAMVRFDVAASVPAGAKILTARLSVNVTKAANSQTVSLMGHRLLESWGEGTSIAGGGAAGGGAGASATPGDATWLHRLYPGTLWSVQGGTFAATPSFTISAPPLGLATAPNAVGAVTDAQLWLDNPAQNFGWLLKSAEIVSSTARRMGSREDPGIKPTLAISYVAPGQVASWGTGCPVGAGTFGFAYVGAPLGGTTIQLAQSNGPPNAIGANFFSLALDQTGVELFPACRVYLPLGQEIIAGSVFVLSGAGAASSPFGVPAGYPNYLVVSQSVALVNNPVGFVVSNAGVAVLQ